MFDINTEIEKVLAQLPYKQSFFYPKEWCTLPIISFYDMNTTGSFDSDNEKDIVKCHVVIDIWTKEPAEGGKIAAEIMELLEKENYWNELNRALPEENRICHRTMRFGKEILIN